MDSSWFGQSEIDFCPLEIDSKRHYSSFFSSMVNDQSLEEPSFEESFSGKRFEEITQWKPKSWKRSMVTLNTP